MLNSSFGGIYNVKHRVAAALAAKALSRCQGLNDSELVCSSSGVPASAKKRENSSARVVADVKAFMNKLTFQINEKGRRMD
jgi:hypothetical protein